MPSKRHPFNFFDDYAKMRERTRREYGEREYNDRFRPERPTSMVRDTEPDYTSPTKPFKPEIVPELRPSETLDPIERAQLDYLQKSLEHEHITKTELPPSPSDDPHLVDNILDPPDFTTNWTELTPLEKTIDDDLAKVGKEIVAEYAKKPAEPQGEKTESWS